MESHWGPSKSEISKSIQDKSGITLYLSKGEPTGNDELMLTKTQPKQILKAMALGVGVNIKISQTHQTCHTVWGFFIQYTPYFGY